MPADGSWRRRFLPLASGKAATIDEIRSAPGGFDGAYEPATPLTAAVKAWKMLTSAASVLLLRGRHS